MLSACCVNIVSQRLGTEQPTYRASSRLAPAAHGRCLVGVSLRHRHSTFGLTRDEIHGGEWYRGIVYYLIPGKTKANSRKTETIFNSIRHHQRAASGPARANAGEWSPVFTSYCITSTHVRWPVEVL